MYDAKKPGHRQRQPSEHQARDPCRCGHRFTACPSRVCTGSLITEPQADPAAWLSAAGAEQEAALPLGCCPAPWKSQFPFFISWFPPSHHGGEGALTKSRFKLSHAPCAQGQANCPSGQACNPVGKKSEAKSKGFLAESKDQSSLAWPCPLSSLTPSPTPSPRKWGGGEFTGEGAIQISVSQRKGSPHGAALEHFTGLIVHRICRAPPVSFQRDKLPGQIRAME